MVKLSGDSKCCLKDTENGTMGEAMPGQNTSLKIQWCGWSFSLVYIFWGYFNICTTDEDTLYTETQNITFAFDFTNSLLYIALFSGFLVQKKSAFLHRIDTHGDSYILRQYHNYDSLFRLMCT